MTISRKLFQIINNYNYKIFNDFKGHISGQFIIYISKFNGSNASIKSKISIHHRCGFGFNLKLKKHDYMYIHKYKTIPFFNQSILVRLLGEYTAHSFLGQPNEFFFKFNGEWRLGQTYIWLENSNKLNYAKISLKSQSNSIKL